ncbi:DUF2141 domain-containing protein [Gracilimonas sp.]|uniref:DUF2141 domain-containing protein n=1 Tax=Gracilimonas sp. TaxID=1974203 RepID=UPI002872294D|nr:DUF2141 domain-containing protein [Gracilimonas sp.]
MKIFFVSLIISLISISAFAQEIAYPEKENLRSEFELKINNIPKVEGEVRVAVFDSKENYDSKENPLHAFVLTVEGDSLTWKHDELPYGEYAIAVYHDENENGELDTNLLGIPKEAYGFSNNARGRFGPASWKDAVFEISESRTTHQITIN